MQILYSFTDHIQMNIALKSYLGSLYLVCEWCFLNGEISNDYNACTATFQRMALFTMAMLYHPAYNRRQLYEDNMAENDVPEQFETQVKIHNDI